MSLRLRVLAAIMVAVAAGVTAYGAIAYRTMRSSLVTAARVRMLDLARQVTQGAPGNNAARERRLTAVAADPAIAGALRRRTPAGVEAARVALAPLTSDSSTLVVSDLRDSTGRLVASARVGDRPFVHPTLGTDTVTATALFARADTVYIEYGAPVMVAGRVVGRVSQVRRMSHATTSNITQILSLIGSEARILLGNADGSVWTDLATRVARPPPSFTKFARYERDGRMRLSIGSPYPGPPLVASIEMPEDVVLAPLRTTLRKLSIIGVLLVLAAGAIGWWASSGITRPIERLTMAAERISGGDLASPILGERAMPPVNRLAGSFESMRRSVKASQDTLEAQVAERTRALREAQEALVRKEKLAILGQLSSSVGHELRNPLGVMTNAIYVLEMTLPAAPQKARDYLGVLRSQVQLSEKIVSDLLDFARVKEPQRTVVAMHQLVEEQLGRVTIPSNVRVERDFAAGLPTVRVDAVQIGQVVLNLLTNATQAMADAGGVLTVRAEAEQGRMRLRVADTGPGIAAEDIARVFEPLFTTKARGIGLGLSVSQLLAMANSGELTVVSEPGHGAAFTLDLPVGAPA